MPAIDRGLDRLTFLPEALREALRRRLRELGGLALILVATLLALALATWSVQDPSLSHATNAPVRNVLGVSGAIVADLLIQLLGVAALVLVLPIAIWGWRLATHRPLQRERIRLAVLRPRRSAGHRLCCRAAAQPGLAAAGGPRRRHRRLDAAVSEPACRRHAVRPDPGSGRDRGRRRNAGVLCDCRRLGLAGAVSAMWTTPPMTTANVARYRSAGSPTAFSASRPGSRALLKRRPQSACPGTARGSRRAEPRRAALRGERARHAAAADRGGGRRTRTKTKRHRRHDASRKRRHAHRARRPAAMCCRRSNSWQRRKRSVGRC